MFAKRASVWQRKRKRTPVFLEWNEKTIKLVEILVWASLTNLLVTSHYESVGNSSVPLPCCRYKLTGCPYQRCLWANSYCHKLCFCKLRNNFEFSLHYLQVKHFHTLTPNIADHLCKWSVFKRQYLSRISGRANQNEHKLTMQHLYLVVFIYEQLFVIDTKWRLWA